MGNAADWLEEGEEIIAQKSVSLDKAQYAGRLYVTSRAVHFHCNVEMVTVGPAHRSRRVGEITNKRFTLAYADLLDAAAIKKFFIFNVLYLKPKEGSALNFWFGVMSAKEMAGEIRKRIGKDQG